jgi:hypothetical protein
MRATQFRKNLTGRAVTALGRMVMIVAMVFALI